MTRPRRRGGARPGAGRKSLGNVFVGIRLAPNYATWIRTLARRALVSNGAIVTRLIQLHSIQLETEQRPSQSAGRKRAT